MRQRINILQPSMPLWQLWPLEPIYVGNYVIMKTITYIIDIKAPDPLYQIKPIIDVTAVMTITSTLSHMAFQVRI